LHPPHRVLVVMIRPPSSPGQVTGGGEVSTIQIALHLRRLGVDMSTIEGFPSVMSGFARELKVYTLAQTRGLLRTIVGVIEAARLTGCDSIYAYTDYVQETIVPSFIAAVITRKRLFVNVLGAPGASGRRTEDSMRFLAMVKDRVKRKPGFRSLFAYVLFQASRRVGCRTGTCLVATHYVETYTRSLLHSRRTFVVGRGVEGVWFDQPSAPKIFDGVYSGRFDRSKRVSILAKSWRLVVAKKPDAKLLLIGESGEDFPQVARFVRDSGLSSNVIFAGFVKDREALVEKVRSARIFIFPSVKEGFGLVVAEAMAAGLPCILSDIPPLREAFGGSAVLVKPDDPSAFAEAILALLSDDEMRSEYSKRSRSLAKSFSWDEVARGILKAMASP
jgi:glycosyltransferase involved in cell wall biosynthesis